MDKLVLKKPVMIDGEEKKEIEYDLDALTGEDIQLAVKELQQNGLVVTAVELDMNYHAALFARAADLSFLDMKRLSVKDYNKATTLVRDFFLQDTEE